MDNIKERWYYVSYSNYNSKYNLDLIRKIKSDIYWNIKEKHNIIKTLLKKYNQNRSVIINSYNCNCEGEDYQIQITL